MKKLILIMTLLASVSCTSGGDDDSLGDECGNVFDRNKIELCMLVRKPDSEEAIFLKSYRSGSTDLNGWRVSIDDGANWHEILGSVKDGDLFKIGNLPFHLKDTGEITVILQDQHDDEVDKKTFY